MTDSLEETTDEKVVSNEHLKFVVEEHLEPVAIEKKEHPRDGYKSGIYRNSAERAEDNKSSAWTLLSVGVIGVIALVLVMAGVIPIHFNGITKYIFEYSPVMHIHGHLHQSYEKTYENGTLEKCVYLFEYFEI